MALADDVKLLKNPQAHPFDAQTLAAVLRIKLFLESVLDTAGVCFLPRGYCYDISGNGCDALGVPGCPESEEECARIFAGDVASGLLEDLCAALDLQRAARIRKELGL